jgi:hypothetical protein
MKALLFMIVKRLHKVCELLAVLEEETPEMQKCLSCFLKEGAFLPSAPSRGA